MPTVLVTGAGRGLGFELVRQYAADGWAVLACVRSPAKAFELAALAADAAGRVEIHALDLADHASIDALAAQLAGRPIDVLLNSAGTMGQGSFAAEGIAFGRFGSSDFGDWMQVLRINSIGPMKMAEAFVTHVAASQQKKIVALSSVIGSIERNRIGGLYAYRASKAALNAIMRSMAIDLQKSHGILAAPIHPGWVKTDMGGPRADIDAVTSITGVRNMIARLDAERAGRFWMYDGSELPW
ncbi:MAG: SDR family oxidoreductase [Steroidobacteraceae bacterium]|nr:SDR family oxidoreductase [Nevskiaceae bacterium]